MGFSANSEDSVLLSLWICSSLSLLGSFSIVLIYTLFKSLRTSAFKLVLYMTIADIIRAVGFLLPEDPHASCICQAVLTSFGSLSGLIWTSIIAFSLYCVVILEIPHIERYEKFMILIGYCLPFLIILLPWTTGSYGKSDGWCWIKDDEYKVLWQIGSFYAIAVLIVVFNIWSYYKIITEIKYDIGMLQESAHEISGKHRLFNRFSLYPLVIVACYLPVFTKRLYEIISGSSLLWLTIVSAVTTSIIGFLNAIVYGLTDNVKETVMNSCRKDRESSAEYSINEIDQLINFSI